MLYTAVLLSRLSLLHDHAGRASGQHLTNFIVRQEEQHILIRQSTLQHGTSTSVFYWRTSVPWKQGLLNKVVLHAGTVNLKRITSTLHVRACMCACLCVHVHLCMRVYMWVHACVRACVCARICLQLHDCLNQSFLISVNNNTLSKHQNKLFHPVSKIWEAKEHLVFYI